MIYVQDCDIEIKKETRRITLNYTIKDVQELEKLRKEIQAKYRTKKVYFRFAEIGNNATVNIMPIKSKEIKPIENRLHNDVKIFVKTLKINNNAKDNERI